MRKQFFSLNYFESVLGIAINSNTCVVQLFVSIWISRKCPGLLCVKNVVILNFETISQQAPLCSILDLVNICTALLKVTFLGFKMFVVRTEFAVVNFQLNFV